MRILVLTPYLPHRRVGHGGGIAVRDLLSWLARKHEVTAACLVRPGEFELVDDVRALGVSVEPLPFSDRRAQGGARAGLLLHRAEAVGRAARSGFPVYAEKYWSAGLSARLTALVERLQPDAVQIEYLQMALYCRDLRRQRAGDLPRLVLNTHELGSVPRERRARLAATPWARALARAEAARWRRLQVAACGWADRTLCVTPEDRDLLAAMGGTRLSTVPLGMDLEAIQPDWAPPGGAPRFLFVGSFGHAPNRSGARLLVDVVWPLVRKAQPDAQLELVGRGWDAFVSERGGAAACADRGVAVLGYVDDLGPVFRRCHAFAAPLTEGGGIKIKVLEALARGVPVVTTEVGAEGIAPAGGEALLVAPADPRFAQAMLELAGDTVRSHRLARGGRRLMEDHFGWESITGRLTRIYAGDEA
jgi:glycosyltransferase involved in cell wall biosynthesis